MPPPIVLALDVGSSSVRVRAFDCGGRPMPGARATREYAIVTGADGAAEMDVDELLETTFACLDAALAEPAAAGQAIAAVAVSTFVGSVVGVDAAGRAVTPLILYSDTRAAPEVAHLRAGYDERAFHQRTGCRFHTSYLPAQFLWMARARGGWLHSARRWLPLPAYLELKLFGEARVSHSVASWTGLLDRTTLAWDAGVLDALPIGADQLAPLCDAGDARRGLQPPFASRWPALRDVPWFPAIGDGAAANVGSGCTDARRMAVTIGTSTAVRVVVPDFQGPLPSALWCYRVDRRRSLLGGALNEGGNVFAWAQKVLRLPDAASLDAALADVPAEGHGLAFLPLLGGERSPGWEPALRGAVSGLSLSTTPVHLLRAALEGIAFRIASVCGPLDAALGHPPDVVASGGGLLHSPAWLRILADVLGRAVHVSAVDEVSARGAALLALEALGEGRLEEHPAPVTHVVEPDRERHDAYRRTMRRQQALYDHLLKELEAGDVQV
jgi:gluconokinase